VLLGNFQVSFHLSLTCVGKGMGIACHGLMHFSILVIAGWKLIWICPFRMPPLKLYNNLKLDSTTLVCKYSFGCSFVFHSFVNFIMLYKRFEIKSLIVWF
jgi:hypothetical protein